MNGRLEGKVAIVTGASRGIGSAAALALAAEGAAVALAARDEQALAGIAERIEKAGGRALVVPTDVTDAASVERLVDRAVGSFGRLDLALNNAGGSGHPPTPLAEVAIDDFDSAYALNLRGVFLVLKVELPATWRPRQRARARADPDRPPLRGRRGRPAAGRIRAADRPNRSTRGGRGRGRLAAFR